MSLTSNYIVASVSRSTNPAKPALKQYNVNWPPRGLHSSAMLHNFYWRSARHYLFFRPPLSAKSALALPISHLEAHRDTVRYIPMPLWKVTLAYDGTGYNGWQIQPSQPTIQGTLAQAIERITGETVLPQGSGRTDTGVHALAQIATFALTVPIPAANLHRALNRALPPSIRILTVEPAPQAFHARYNALRKTYEYRIFARVLYPPTVPPTVDLICSPMLAPYVWDCPLPLDFAILQNAADHIRGTHDFTSFAAVDPDLTTRNAEPATNPNALSFLSVNSEPVISTEGGAFAAVAEKPASLPHISNREPPTNIRTIYHSSWQHQDGLLIYRVTGNGFLHHMVRNLVGTFAEAATGRISADDIPTILAAKNRSAAGPTAPARGLFLVEVEY
jgi:tRNA pseudouridine38-40 synthase